MVDVVHAHASYILCLLGILNISSRLTKWLEEGISERSFNDSIRAGPQWGFPRAHLDLQQAPQLRFYAGGFSKVAEAQRPWGLCGAKSGERRPQAPASVAMARSLECHSGSPLPHIPHPDSLLCCFKSMYTARRSLKENNHSLLPSITALPPSKKKKKKRKLHV